MNVGHVFEQDLTREIGDIGRFRRIRIERQVAVGGGCGVGGLAFAIVGVDLHQQRLARVLGERMLLLQLAEFLRRAFVIALFELGQALVVEMVGGNLRIDLLLVFGGAERIEVFQRKGKRGRAGHGERGKRQKQFRAIFAFAVHLGALDRFGDRVRALVTDVASRGYSGALPQKPGFCGEFKSGPSRQPPRCGGCDDTGRSDGHGSRPLLSRPPHHAGVLYKKQIRSPHGEEEAEPPSRTTRAVHGSLKRSLRGGFLRMRTACKRRRPRGGALVFEAGSVQLRSGRKAGARRSARAPSRCGTGASTKRQARLSANRASSTATFILWPPQ